MRISHEEPWGGGGASMQELSNRYHGRENWFQIHKKKGKIIPVGPKLAHLLKTDNTRSCVEATGGILAHFSGEKWFFTPEKWAKIPPKITHWGGGEGCDSAVLWCHPPVTPRGSPWGNQFKPTVKWPSVQREPCPVAALWWWFWWSRY